jgi:predicted glycogen debranching enzyme
VHAAPTAEWLEADGLGGFASGTVGLVRTRRYHALLCAAARPPSDRFVLVNGFEAEIATPRGTFPITSHRYLPGVTHPAGASFVSGFDIEPWPLWRFALPDGAVVEQTIAAVHDRPMTTVSWRLVSPSPDAVRLTVRLLLSGRGFHALQRENRAFRFEEERHGESYAWRPYDGVPAIAALANGAYAREPLWYRNFLYEEERARGLEAVEDLASPGRFEFDLAHAPACLVLAAATPGGEGDVPVLAGDAAATLRGLRARERRRRARFRSRLEGAAEAYVVRRGEGRSLIAGYPWFGDWGRDTFIALRGLMLARGRLDPARAILLEWSRALSQGMLPNRFPDHGGPPEYDSVDAALWFVVAAHEWAAAMRRMRRPILPSDEAALRGAVETILAAHVAGTRHGIRAAEDGLLAAGEPGTALTWMDARVAGRAITPRIGKPVEVQALWINALRIASSWNDRFAAIERRARASFPKRFWNARAGALHDVVDPDDPTLRPNQILAVGGLPYALLEGDRARAVVETVERRLLTPVGLRTLDPDDPAYAPRYAGSPETRDAAYHQGTVWPWLLGPFVEAWVRVRGGEPAARREARRRFLEPLVEHLEEGGLEHIAEIADGEAPHALRGCPFQAWSVGEALRLSLRVLR